jgi:hypothetical protein
MSFSRRATSLLNSTNKVRSCAPRAPSLIVPARAYSTPSQALFAEARRPRRAIIFPYPSPLIVTSPPKPIFPTFLSPPSVPAALWIVRLTVVQKSASLRSDIRGFEVSWINRASGRSSPGLCGGLSDRRSRSSVNAYCWMFVMGIAVVVHASISRATPS